MKIRISVLFSLILFILPQLVSAVDTTKIDSLESVLLTKKDTARITILLLLSEEYQKKGKPDKSMERAKQGLQESEKLNFKAGIARSYSRQAHLLSEGSSFQDAIGYYNKALEIAEEMNDLPMQADCLTGTGSIYRRMGKYTEGLTILFKALKIMKNLVLRMKKSA